MERGSRYSCDMEMTLLETIVLRTLISAGYQGSSRRLCPLTSGDSGDTCYPNSPFLSVGHIDSLVLLWAGPCVSRDQFGSPLLFFVDLVFAGSVRA